jgi:hypothetical protein
MKTEYKVKSKPAIAMIELIFALVIMGIVLLSAPMLIQQSIRSGNVALQQEAIAVAASHTGVILSMNWDEENANLSAGTSPILDTNRTLPPAADPLAFNAGALKGLNGVNGRVSLVGGVQILTPSIVFGRDETNDTDTNESDFLDFDDIDDYDNSKLGITVYNNEDTTSDMGDYVDVNLSMKTDITYAEDRPSSNTLNSTSVALGSQINKNALSSISNIKFIHVHLTSESGIDELNKSIVLEAFSCNIGTYLPQGETEL